MKSKKQLREELEQAEQEREVWKALAERKHVTKLTQDENGEWVEETDIQDPPPKMRSLQDCIRPYGEGE